MAALSFIKLRTQSRGGEIDSIKATSDLQQQTILYLQLIKRVGPERAQEDLFRSGLPFTGQTHLLNHAVGDFLYEKFGNGGLVYCKDYFLSSCYHGFLLHVIGTDANPNYDEIKEVLEVCLQKGNPTRVQCSHAVGHGFLASVGYKNLDKAISLCEDASSKVPDLTLYNCHDGAYMENVWAIHEGQPSPDRWVKADDPHYPCNDKRLPKYTQVACWSNQPPLLFQEYKGDISKVAKVCRGLSQKDLQDMCYDGLARQINPLTNGEPERVIGLCRLVTPSWVNRCVATNATASFSVGDRDRVFRICSLAPPSGREECYQKLDSIMRVFIMSPKERQPLCAKIPDERWRATCSS